MTLNRISAEELAFVHEEGRAAAATFDATLQDLVATIGSTDAIEVLSRAGFQLLMRGPDRPDQIQAAGIELFHVELIQSLALAAPRAAPHRGTDYPAVTSKVLQLIERNSAAYRDRAKLKMNGDEAHDERERLLALVQSWTLVVRGARHEFQTRAYAFAIA